MGLFNNSEKEKKRAQILNDIVIVNRHLRDIANTLDSQGINRESIKSINVLLVNAVNPYVNVSNIVQSMSDSQLEGFSVPWTDGRYIGIMMWILSSSTMVNNVAEEIENFAKR